MASLNVSKREKQNGVEHTALPNQWMPNNPAERGVVRHPQTRQASYRRGGGAGKCAVCKLKREKGKKKKKKKRKKKEMIHDENFVLWKVRGSQAG